MHSEDNLAVHEEAKKERLGERLLDMGLISEDQLNVALQEKKNSSKMIGQILIDLGFISGQMLSSILAEKSGFQIFDPKLTLLDSDLLDKISKEDAVKFQIIPVSYDEGAKELTLAMSDPYDVVAMDAMRQFFPEATVKPAVTSAAVISSSIDRAYGYASSIPDILDELEGREATDVTVLSEETAYTHPIVRLVNAFVLDAVKIGASDIHFEPEEHFIRLRYRLDGELFNAHTLHKQHWSAISQRIKIVSNMDISDKLSPQDGRFSMNVGGRDVDFRVSSLPTVYGENIVLRVLDKSIGVMALQDLGFTEAQLKLVEQIQKKPEGIIIVTGPTGSGKTTTLYSMLNVMNTPERNIQTLEDPVEYALPMVRQTNVRPGILEFADGIRSILRQDPDIIFIGEIRDSVTAEMALKAAMTGHQVYTTLHTNDCFGAVPRLMDLGLKPGMLSGAVIASSAQRLMRRLCSDCKEAYQASAEEKKLLGTAEDKDLTLYRAKGCEKCRNTGYKGRVVVSEILFFDDEIDAMVASGKTRLELKEAASRKGFKSLKEDAAAKVIEGVSSVEAAEKVVSFSEGGLL